MKNYKWVVVAYKNGFEKEREYFETKEDAKDYYDYLSTLFQHVEIHEVV